MDPVKTTPVACWSLYIIAYERTYGFLFLSLPSKRPWCSVASAALFWGCARPQILHCTRCITVENFVPLAETMWEAIRGWNFTPMPPAFALGGAVKIQSFWEGPKVSRLWKCGTNPSTPFELFHTLGQINKRTVIVALPSLLSHVTMQITSFLRVSGYNYE